jgi:phosphate starvation-inducible PhoH-like protein
MTIRTPDFHRIADAFARGEGPQLQSLLDRAARHRHQPQDHRPEDPRPEALPAVDARAPGRLRHRPGRHRQDLPRHGRRGLALLKNEVERIILTRPAVEAGEALGFLPGDLREKILPYLRPLYDALHDMLDAEDVARLTEKGVIEIAPLAYMRGRTLSRAFVVLDEAQNTTPSR